MILVLVTAAQIVWSGPRLSSAAAAAILRESPGLSNRTNVPLASDGPIVVIMGSSPTAGPFGEFAPFPPARRLDGTLLSQRPSTMRAYMGRRPSERFEHGQRPPPTFVGTRGGLGASARPPGPGSVGRVTTMSGNPR